MSIRTIFLLLLFSLHVTQITSVLLLDDRLIYHIRQEFIKSKGHFVRNRNSTHNIFHLKLPFPSVTVNGISYNFLPEPLGFAWIRNPESLDLTNHNKTCLDNWRITYDEKVAQRNFYSPLCEWIRADVDDCEVDKPRLTCADYATARSVTSWGDMNFFDGSYVVDNFIFPDGRDIDSIQWNCSANYDCCHSGCCLATTPLPTSPTTPTSTTVTPTTTTVAQTTIISFLSRLHELQNLMEESERNDKIVKIVVISSLLFVIILSILRYYGYWNRGQTAGSIPYKKQYDLVFSPHKKHDVYPQSDCSSPVFDRPPAYY